MGTANKSSPVPNGDRGYTVHVFGALTNAIQELAAKKARGEPMPRTDLIGVARQWGGRFRVTEEDVRRLLGMTMQEIADEICTPDAVELSQEDQDDRTD